MIKLKLPFKKKEDFHKEFLALDLGGNLLKALLFKIEEDYVRLLGVRKEPRGEDPEVALKEIIEDLKDDFPDLPKDVVIGVSGPLTAAFTTVVKSGLAKSADEIAEHARELALKQVEKELRQSLGDPKLSLLELEAEVLEVKKMEKLELFLFTSFGEKSYLRDLESLLRGSGLSLWGFSSLPFNLVSSLSGEEGKLNALIFDIGATKTEISLVFGGELMDTKSFWWEFPPALEKNSDLFLDLWLNAVSGALGAFEETRVFPSRILLTGGGAALPDLVKRVSDFPWGRDHPLDSSPEVSIISKDMLVGINAEGTGLDLPEDILPLSLGRVALRMKEEELSEEEIDEEEEEEGK
jgi:hypothetical protein